jgi:hypothetical protein
MKDDDSPNEKSENVMTFSQLLTYYKEHTERKEHKDDKDVKEHKERKNICYKDVVADILKKDYYHTFFDDVSTLPDKVLYSLWQSMFLSADLCGDYVAMADLTKSQEKYLIAKRDNKRRYLTVLTDKVLSTYRNTILINDVFLAKLYEHDLEKIILHILHNSKFYHVKLLQGSLLDNLIILSMETNNIRILRKLLPAIKVEHMEHALRYSSYAFLTLMLKIKKWIPNFDKNIEWLETNMKNKDWKQLKFFDKCRS